MVLAGFDVLISMLDPMRAAKSVSLKGVRVERAFTRRRLLRRIERLLVGRRCVLVMLMTACENVISDNSASVS